MLGVSSTVVDVFALRSLSTSVLCGRNCANTNAIHVLHNQCYYYKLVIKIYESVIYVATKTNVHESF